MLVIRHRKGIKSVHTQNKEGNKRISDQLIADVIKYVRVGVPGVVAAQACGIVESDYLLWVGEGSSSHHLERCPDCDFATFYLATMQAEAQTEGEMTACILKAAQDGDWRAAAWWLERRFSYWAKGSTLETEAAPASDISVEDVQAKIEELLRKYDEESKE